MRQIIRLKKTNSALDLISKKNGEIEHLEKTLTLLKADFNRLSVERSLVISKAKTAVSKARKEASNARHRANRIKKKLDNIQSKKG